MLPKKSRLSRTSFPKSKPSQRVTFSWGSISLYPSNVFMASVVVSKKTLPRAVDRNRATRRAYAALARVSPAPKLAVIVFPRREALKAPFTLLVADLAHALS
jgi:ribonuclease P protein component